MDWTQIGSALFLVAMLVFIFPRMRHAVKNSPKGSADDIKGVIIPILVVVLFVILLIMMV
jgi:hypothetical protein